jgi:hypothetical protein
VSLLKSKRWKYCRLATRLYEITNLQYGKNMTDQN